MPHKPEMLRAVFRTVARSHMYWGRKPIVPLMEIFGDVKPGESVLDPFCGGGTPLAAALSQGAKVIGCDLNPVAVFLYKVLIRPVNIAALEAAFQSVSERVQNNILSHFDNACPKCGEKGTIDYLVWNGKGAESRAESARINCRFCRKTQTITFSLKESQKQYNYSIIRPKYWFPKTKIQGTMRKSPVEYHYQLFTGRNLASLAQLLDAIKGVSDENCRDALTYVFTAMLYSCSEMQMYSKRYPSSSIGWNAYRYYLPPLRKEVNPWRAFVGRFESFVKAKRAMNSLLPWVRVTDSKEFFASNQANALLFQGDAFELDKELTQNARQVFLDPPYNEDIDYFGFSEFWGSWLGMQFDFRAEWHPSRMKGEGLLRLLKRLHKITNSDCKITLAFAPGKARGWEEEKCILDAGYQIDWDRSAPFLYDNPQARGKGEIRNDFYFALVKKGHAVSQKPDTEDKKRVEPYLRIATHSWPDSDAKANAIRAYAESLVPAGLRSILQKVTSQEIEALQKHKKANRVAYYTLCGILLDILLSKDGWKLHSVGKQSLEPVIFSEKAPIWMKRELPPRFSRAICFAQQNQQKILFYYFDQNSKALSRELRRIAEDDAGEFNLLAVLIAPTKEAAEGLRASSKAKDFPRTFFTSFEELRTIAHKIDPEKYKKFCAVVAASQNSSKEKKDGRNIMSFEAKVHTNRQIGVTESKHRKLSFLAQEMEGVRPAQFIMMDPTPTRNLLVGRIDKPVKLSAAIDRSPQPILKRPFGIHRAFYEGFGETYLQKLRLPQSLALALHTVYPHKFDILYKVLDDGIGTPLMAKLKPGEKVHMIGPLGQHFDVRDLCTQDTQEVHVIGGGVGMAPLVFFVQALRFFSIPVKAFIGISSFEALRYDLDVEFGEKARDAYVYVDDLIQTGLTKDEIYVSCDAKDPQEAVRGLPASNLFKGYVPDQYRQFLKEQRGGSKIRAITCGPNQMMKVMADVCREAGVPLKVLLEKRMGCGVGVCFSCVQKVRRADDTEDYARICKEGPLFDVEEIIWNNDLKPNSAGCGCAPHS